MYTPPKGKSPAASTEKQLRVLEFPDNRIYVMSNFSDKGSNGVPPQLTVYGAIFKGLDCETGKPDAENPAPFAPTKLQVRPFVKSDQDESWGQQSFAWRYTETKCQDSASLRKGLAGHWVCTDTDGRVLVSVTGCGVMPLARSFTEHEMYFLSKKQA
jgi:hypothetical protein